MTTLIISPHPDDEVLGVGGTIPRLDDVHVAIMTEWSDLQSKAEAQRAHDYLGVTSTYYHGFPAAGLDTVPQAELNDAIVKLVGRVKPDIMFVPFPGDLHIDHKAVYNACMVAVRMQSITVYAYETLSETYYDTMPPNFVPNVYSKIDIMDKLKAMWYYKSQLKEPPHERSLESIAALAALRGANVGLSYAEGFMLLRKIR